MPRAFTDSEKQAIQKRLLQSGRERFARYGLRKTNVEELTKDTGISKGAFYLFYQSKEELYFDVMWQVESEIQAGLLEAVQHSGESSKKGFAQFLSKSLAILETHPFFTNTGDEDYQYLLRSISPEQLQVGIEKDEAFVARLLSVWAERGVIVDYEPKLVSAILRSMVFISTHKGEFEPDLYHQMMDLLVDSIAQRLVSDKEPTVNRDQKESAEQHNG
ncbi:MAG: TetR/AcrR family transcriptional regulator [Chloroflexia bacterium]